MSVEILHSQPVFRRGSPRGTTGDRLTLTSIHDGKSVWAKREDGMHTNVGLTTLFTEYFGLATRQHAGLDSHAESDYLLLGQYHDGLFS